MTTLRPLALADSKVLAALDALCFGDEAWSEDQIVGSLSLPTTVGIGGLESGTIIGFYLIQQTEEETEILTLGVHPAHQRKGIGEQMLADIIARQRQGTIFLDVAADNLAARKLYENAGFKPFAIRPRYYRRAGCWVDAINYRYNANN